MKTYSNNPNFTIVMPGGCNAKCNFCFNKGITGETKNVYEYMTTLENIMLNIDDKFNQISISGGEPLLSPRLHNVLYLLGKYKSRFPKVVLTTNGTNLLETIPEFRGIVNHINISRHHYDEYENIKIFNGTYNVTNEYTKQAIRFANSFGIDVCANCVINEETSVEFILKFLSMAHKLKFNSISFRKVAGTLAPTAVEEFFSGILPVSVGNCPVCRSKTQIIDGMFVTWKASIPEPDDKLDSVYEVIYQSDGKLYSDWSRKHLIDIVPRIGVSHVPTAPTRISIYQTQSCGSSGCHSEPVSHCGSRGCGGGC